MFDSPRLFRRSDPDFPITPAVQRRLIEAGRVEGEGPRAPAAPAGQRCRLCSCNIDRDPEADRSIPACGSCKARPDAHASSKSHAARAFTEADRSLIRKIQGYMPRMQLLGILNDRLRADIGSDAPPYTIEQLHAEITALWRKIITYTRVDEAGTSLRAAGWTQEGRVRGRGWHSERRARSNTNSWIDKIRWSRELAVPLKKRQHTDAHAPKCRRHSGNVVGALTASITQLRREHPGSQSRTIVMVAPREPQDVQRTATSANSNSASSPCLRSSRSAGSTPRCAQVLQVNSLSQPGGVSRMLPTRG